MAKLNLDENEIKRLYVEEKKMIREIADIMNCDRNVITRRLQKLGLKEGKSYKNPKEKVDKLADKKELMKTLYLEGKTCKEIGHFKVQQKLIQENDDLRIYRNVYQKLLLRTRRNPTNTKYAREFEFFKDNNNKWRENISKGNCTEKEYVEWLKKQ